MIRSGEQIREYIRQGRILIEPAGSMAFEDK